MLKGKYSRSSNMSGYTELAKLENTRHCLRRIAHHDEQQFSKDSIVNVMERFVKTVNIMDDTILVPCRLMDRQVGDSTDIIPTPGKDSTSNQHTMHSGTNSKRGISHSKNVHEFLTSSELFNLYNMLNALKNELLWTGKDKVEDDEGEPSIYDETKLYEMDNGNHSDLDLKTTCVNNTEANAIITTSISTTSTTIIPVKGHNRRPSTASVASITSVSNMSDSESDVSNENDSGVEFEGNKSDNVQSSADSTSSSEDIRAQKKAANLDKATELAKRCKRHLNGLYQCLEQMTEAANYLTARYQIDIGPV